MSHNYKYCMKNKFLVGISILGMALALNSCDSEENAVPSAAVPANCNTTKMTYSSGPGAPIQVIINTQCATSPSCHGAGAGKINGDFSSWSSAKLQAAISGRSSSNMYQYLQPTYPTPMPNVPQPGWNQCDKLKLEAWLLAGAPQ